MEREELHRKETEKQCKLKRPTLLTALAHCSTVPNGAEVEDLLISSL